MERFQIIDTLRGIAIIGVFLYHALGASFGYDQLPWDGPWRSLDVSRTFFSAYPLTFGRLGVSLFFVISGFCIHWAFISKGSKNFKEFLTRRFYRIYPTYLIIYICVMGLVSLRMHLNGQTFIPTTADIVSHALLIHNFTIEHFLGINASLWSIAIEAQLYLLYPFLFAIAKRLGSWKKAVAVAVLIEISLRAAMSYFTLAGAMGDVRYISQMPFTYWGSWALGVIVAERVFHAPAVDPQVQMPFQLVIGVVLAASILISDWIQPLIQFQFLLASALAALFLQSLLSKKLGSYPKTKARQLLADIGIVSYSLYLIHQPILEWLWFIPGHPVLRFLSAILLLPCVFIIARLAYRHIELPTAAWGKGLR